MNKEPIDPETVEATANKLFKLPQSWVFKSLCLAGLGLNLWFNQHYVSIDKYQKDQDSAQARNDKVDATLVSIDKTTALLARQIQEDDRFGVQLADHETRLRVLEGKR